MLARCCELFKVLDSFETKYIVGVAGIRDSNKSVTSNACCCRPSLLMKGTRCDDHWWQFITITTYSFNDGNCLSIGITAEGGLRLAIGGTRNNILVLSNTDTEPKLVEIVNIAWLYSVLIVDSLELMNPPENSIRTMCFFLSISWTDCLRT